MQPREWTCGPDTTYRGGGDTQHLIRAYLRVVDRISDYVGYLAASVIFVLVATLLLAAVTRNLLNIP